jgi:hypothetical protein
LDKRLESRIAMQRIEERIDFDEGNAVSVAVFVYRNFKKRENLRRDLDKQPSP